MLSHIQILPFYARCIHWLLILCLLAAWFIAPIPAAHSAPAPQRVEVLVLVNSDSRSYADFARWIQPYLDNFGVPYQLLDLAKAPLPQDCGSYAAILIGHARLDLEGKYLTLADQQTLAQAVKDGTGLINFDNDLSDLKGAPRYAFIQDLFGFQYSQQKVGVGLRFSQPSAHYITQLHSQGEALLTARMSTAGLRAPAGGTVLAEMWDKQPFLAVTQVGVGRAVQWTSYDWISDPARGPLSGLDDLVWRSIVWAARKPFVMQAMPPFVTMRVDDVSGPLWWAHTASEDFAFKPWIGFFINDFSPPEARDLSGLVNAGKATALVHAFNMENFLYGDHLASRKDGSNLPDALTERYFDQGIRWHMQNNVPFSKFTVGHYYEMSANAFPHLKTLGVEFVGTLMDPGKRYGDNWVQEGPYRRDTRGSSKATRPFYYADYIQVPGHPELDGKFFNCMTEIRDDAGYEWFPGRDVQGSIDRGVRQTQRALNSLVLATLFTHEYHILEAGPDKWHAILQGVTERLADQHPMYVTLDQACQYARAIHDTRISSSGYDPAAHQLTATLEGRDDVSTLLYLFTGQGNEIKQQFLSVPVITDTVTVSKELP